ncbi:trihelix transcription factor GT-2-like [Glycine soja]|uniref:Trihelix transcription factor GT-2 n=1 Tax=Glycine soja TaxID=3848 RepID=A0A445LLD7_GLYSO|nr:trihelix transcription factor GT-2-like [Glycine soja]RZC23952.1 Trihelix transcription factor GT-2 [Glycine soja]
MQLGDSSVLEISSHTEPEMAVVSPPEEAPHEGGHNSGGGGGSDEMIGMDLDANSGEGNEGNKMSFGGNRWPRQETLALLKIRLDMDAVFRDSSLKGPLWEEVSRKLAELGYQRSAKKCKEKFENVYKYNKRTKENKSGKSHGKAYKFFDQLQALENQFTVSYPPKPQPTSTLTTTNTLTSDHGNKVISYVTPFPSTNPTLIPPSPQTNTNTTTTTTTTSTTDPRDSSPPQTNNNNNSVPHSLPNMNAPFLTTTTSTSSSTASDEDLEERYRRKRKWKDYFRRLTRKVLSKQEEMQKKFLEAMDQRERERVAQQDNWRMQEMARINREHEILVQERSTASAKDAAVIALLQKMYGQQNPTQHVEVEPPQQQKQTMPQSQPPILMPNNNFEVKKMNNGHSATSTTTTTTSPVSSSSSSRWPKAEVHDLIRLRTSLEIKYQENGPKAPLWEDISIAMQRLGYNRSAKRCKEKWENINKYFKKVRESSKERREDSKTCPYFHELEALYKEKGKSQNPFGMFQNMTPNETMMMEPLMVQPEQQWRPPPQSLEEGIGKDNASEEYNQEKEEEVEENGGDDDNIEEDGDSVEDAGPNPCEIATNN